MAQLSDVAGYFPIVAELPPREREAVSTFTLLWTLFEAQQLNTHASICSITRRVDELDSASLEAICFQKQLKYFSDRFFAKGKPTNHFKHLHLEKHSASINESVIEVLVGKNDNPRNQLVTCLTIVYRFRNNFFHGVKWSYGIRDQYDNFCQSSSLLNECLQKFPKVE